MNGIITSMKSKNIVDLTIKGSYKEAITTYLSWVKKPDLDLNYNDHMTSALKISKHLIIDCNSSQPWTKDTYYQDLIKFEFLTVSEFNDKYGHDAYYNKNKYAITEESDVNTVICMLRDTLYPIPYFSIWLQSATITGLEDRITDFLIHNKKFNHSDFINFTMIIKD